MFALLTSPNATAKSAMNSSNTATNMDFLSDTTNNLSSTTTANPSVETKKWLVIGILIAVAIILAVILLLLLYRTFCRHHRDYENFSDATVERGLPNLGNTCYFNAAIQGLSSTPILKTQMIEIDAKEGQLTDEFIKFLEPVNPDYIKVSRSLDPRSLLTVFCQKVTRFGGTEQHDSHEFLRNFLDQLRQEERASMDLDQLTVVDKIFGGHFMTIYTCTQCEMPYHVCEPFLDISVPVCRGDLSSSDTSEKGNTEKTRTEPWSPYQEAAKSIMETLSVKAEGILSVEDCLQYFTRCERICQEYLCKRCEYDRLSSGTDPSRNLTFTSATKQTLIFNPPAILVIHLKRFEIKSHGFEKRTNKIKFEELLDIAPYCSSWCQRNEARESNIWYSLYAVVVHSGTLSSGHYVAYVKERRENKDIEKFLQEKYFDRDVTAEQLVEMMTVMKQKEKPKVSTKAVAKRGTWYCMNDSRVSKVFLEEVLTKEVFLLFYERISPI